MKLFGKKKLQDPVVNLSSTEFEINKWVISEFVISKLVPIVDKHPFPLDELMLMSSSVVRFRPQMILEWGTNIGKSARIFHETCEAFRVDAEIHSIDLPDEIEHNEHPQKRRGIMVKGIRRVTLHQADGVTKAIELCKLYKPERTLFFVDGDHSYESVKRELSIILHEVPNAAVLLHDTFYQSESSGYNIGPWKAIREITRESDKYTLIQTQGGLPGMTLLFVKDAMPKHW